MNILKISQFIYDLSVIRSWNEPVLSNKGKVCCSRKRWGSLMGFEPTTFTLQVRCAIYCPTPPTNIVEPRKIHYRFNKCPHVLHPYPLVRAIGPVELYMTFMNFSCCFAIESNQPAA